jgi:hypothetical protein
MKSPYRIVHLQNWPYFDVAGWRLLKWIFTKKQHVQSWPIIKSTWEACYPPLFEIDIFILFWLFNLFGVHLLGKWSLDVKTCSEYQFMDRWTGNTRRTHKYCGCAYEISILMSVFRRQAWYLLLSIGTDIIWALRPVFGCVLKTVKGVLDTELIPTLLTRSLKFIVACASRNIGLEIQPYIRSRCFSQWLLSILGSLWVDIGTSY